MPWRTAASVAGRPAMPTMAATTTIGRPLGGFHKRVPPCRCFDAAACQKLLELGVKRFVGDDGEFGARGDRGLRERIDIGVGGKRDDLKIGRAGCRARDDIERRCANRTRGAKNGDAHPAAHPAPA